MQIAVRFIHDLERTKDHLYFQKNNNENGGKLNFVCYSQRGEIRKIRASCPGCSDVRVLRVF
jgi:hypothetical protein